MTTFQLITNVTGAFARRPKIYKAKADADAARARLLESREVARRAKRSAATRCYVVVIRKRNRRSNLCSAT